MKNPKYHFLVLVLCFIFSSCGGYMHQRPTTVTKARLGEETYSTTKLKSLPSPTEPLYAAVYKFRDQTGQYRPSSQGASWSTAVTQGATNILIRALENSKWFIPVERENVSNLLNERKIIINSRAQYSNGAQQQLPPLLFAGIILEGGIVSYDANVMTGGVGARYFGLGGSAQYRQDRVSVYLRAISTQNGRILKTVYTSKTLLSQSIDGSLFRFVSFQKLLEAETGFTYNEPSELAVSEAIEKAVYSLIVEGVRDSLWSFAGGAQDSLGLGILSEYEEEIKEMEITDRFGRKLEPQRPEFSFGFAGQGSLYNGDILGQDGFAGFNFDFESRLSTKTYLGLETGFSKLKGENGNENFNYINVYSKYRILPYDKLTPFLRIGIGGYANSGEDIYSGKSEYIGQVTYGGGIEYKVSKRLSFSLDLNHHVLFNDKGDLIEQGKYNDMYYRSTLGMRFYIGKIKSERINIYE